MSPLLVWNDSSHWARVTAPCRFCHQPTHLRDNYRRPTHKVCAEEHPEQTESPPRKAR